MREAERRFGEAAKIKYIAEVLRELRRLTSRHQFLNYLIEMAEVEAQNSARQEGTGAVVTASSVSSQPPRGLSEQ